MTLSAPFVTFPAPTVTRFDAEREMREANRKLSALTMADGARQIVADHPDAATLRVSISHDPDAPGVSQYVDVLDVTGRMIAQQQPFTWAERDPNVLEDMGLVTYWDNDAEGRMTGLVRLPVLSELVQLIQDGPKVTDDDEDLLRSTRDGRIQVDRLKDRAWKAHNSAARAYAAEAFAQLQEVYPEADTIEMNVYADEDGQGGWAAPFIRSGRCASRRFPIDGCIAERSRRVRGSRAMNAGGRGCIRSSSRRSRPGRGAASRSC